jgi:hypothetical protein
MTPAFWLSLATVLGGTAGCVWIAARARRRTELLDREIARFHAEVERRRLRLEYDPPENVVDL